VLGQCSEGGNVLPDRQRVRHHVAVSIRTAVPGASAQGAPSPGRSLAIDIVKAIALVGVIAQHGLSDLRGSAGSFWIFQAVPVLVVLFGMNMKASLDRRATLDVQWYLRSYLPRRLDRLLVPFAIVWVVSYLLGRVSGKGHIGGLVLAGVLPLAGPGSYFVPMIILLTVAVPIIYVCYQRSVTATVVVLIILDLGFELVASKIHILMTHGQFLYDASPLRYIVAFIAGFLVVDGAGSRVRRAGAAALVVASLVYLVLELTHGEWFGYFIDKWTRPTNLLAVPYATALTLLLVRALPRTSSNPLIRMAGYAGKASFHVFLVQMVWFVVNPEQGPGPFLVAVVACFAVGMAFFWLENQVIPGRSPKPRPAAPAGAAS
jgi:acyltransferase-like protein